MIPRCEKLPRKVTEKINFRVKIVNECYVPSHPVNEMMFPPTLFKLKLYEFMLSSALRINIPQCPHTCTPHGFTKIKRPLFFKFN